MPKIKSISIQLDTKQVYQPFIYNVRWLVPKSERKLTRIFGIGAMSHTFDITNPAKMKAVLDNILYIQDLDKNIKDLRLDLKVSDHLSIGNIPGGIYFTTLRKPVEDIFKTFNALLIRCNNAT